MSVRFAIAFFLTVFASSVVASSVGHAERCKYYASFEGRTTDNTFLTAVSASMSVDFILESWVSKLLNA
jgi:hypothetical protein